MGRILSSTAPQTQEFTARHYSSYVRSIHQTPLHSSSCDNIQPAAHTHDAPQPHTLTTQHARNTPTPILTPDNLHNDLPTPSRPPRPRQTTPPIHPPLPLHPQIHLRPLPKPHQNHRNLPRNLLPPLQHPDNLPPLPLRLRLGNRNPPKSSRIPHRNQTPRPPPLPPTTFPTRKSSHQNIGFITIHPR